MAHLLLRWPVVNRSWLLAPFVLAASGCLYLDPINQAPSITLEELQITTAHKGEAISMVAHTLDEGSENRTLTVDFKVASADGQPLEPCDYAKTTFGHTAAISFYRTGTFSVSASTVDTYGSPSNNAAVMVTIDDAPPVFEAGAMPIATEASNACHLYTGGQSIRMRLSGKVMDADQFAHNPASSTCGPGETLTYTWFVTGGPATGMPRLTPVVDDKCSDVPGGTMLEVPMASSQVCLWTDSVTATSSYNVVVAVSDGTKMVQTPGAGTVPVYADQSPCITGTELPAGSYVVNRADTQIFQVTGVADDLDAFGSDKLHFDWSIWRDSDLDPMTGQPVWRPVPSHPGASYSLDTSTFGVGEIVKVRVEAVDRTGTHAACDLGDNDCAATSCATSGATCNKWRTWTLELR